MIERAGRVGAIVIAVAALIDPVWGRATTARPEVTLRLAPGANPDTRNLVGEALAARFVVADEASPATAATIVIGRTAPAAVPDGRVFAVTTRPSEATPEIRQVDVPAVVSLDAAADVRVTVATPATPRAPVDVWLEAQGLVLDRQTLNEGGVTGTRDVVLTFVPSRTGLAPLRVGMRAGSGPASYVDAATEVVRRTRRALVYEARPSWSATFIRRALEQDTRLTVATRSQVSRGIGAEAGAPPASLQAIDALSSFDVIVIGAAEGLTERDAETVERYLREREGGVILLPGDAGTATAWSRLAGVAAWNTERHSQLQTVTAGVYRWTASEFLWPRVWPAAAEPMTSCVDANRRCAVWRVPVGGGRVVVSSALDGWRTRAAETSTFDAFWRAVVSEEAALTPDPVAVSLARVLVEPGSRMHARVRAVRGGVLSAHLENTEGVRQPVRLWPGGDRTFEAEWRAPLTPGRYRLSVNRADDDGATTREFMVVDATRLDEPVPASSATLEALATASGGAAVSIDDLPSLPDRLAAALDPPTEMVSVAPMRSPWWIVPLAGLLSVEWWSRRRRGAR